MKISTVHNKISTCHYECLDLASRKSQPGIKKTSTVHNKNGVLYKMDPDMDQDL